MAFEDRYNNIYEIESLAKATCENPILSTFCFGWASSRECN